MIGAIEIGGTKTYVTVGDAEIVRLPTRDPLATLTSATQAIRELSGDAALAGVGLACFGPVDLRAGRMLSTPKDGWSGYPVTDVVAESLDCTVYCETDVTAAAIAEGLLGASIGARSHAYVTVGTGVGVGLVLEGRPLRGRLHPEAGHVSPRRLVGDTFDGSCAWHRDCFEGLIAGPAIRDRCGRSGEEIGDDDPVWELVGRYIGRLCAHLALVAAVECVVVGGPVARRRGVLEAARRQLGEDLARYPDEAPTETGFIRAAELDDHSGLLGALVLAGGARFAARRLRVSRLDSG